MSRKPITLNAGQLEQLPDSEPLLVGSIQFDTAWSGPHAEGQVHWDADDGTISVGMPGGFVEMQVGQEMMLRARNTTGSEIGNGKVVYISGASGNKPTIALADASAGLYPSGAAMGVATEDIAHNSNGYVTAFGYVRDVNTDGMSEGAMLYLSAGTPGAYTETKPTPPDYAVDIGHVVTAHVSSGVIFVHTHTNWYMADMSDVYAPSPADGECIQWIDSASRWEARPTHDDFFNGSFRETFNALCTSDGATITMTLEQAGGGDLTMRFSDGETILDCTDPAQTITVTAGTDAAPQANYVYITRAAKTLIKDTGGWPAEEHIKVAYLLAPSATFVNTYGGCYVNQNCNDHLQNTNDQGHMTHMAKKIRSLGASWFSGVNADGGTASYFTIGVGSTLWKSTSGVVAQLHDQAYPAIDMTGADVAIVANHNDAAYTTVTDLFSIEDDNTGTPIPNNRYFNLVFWGVMNKTGDFSVLMVNLPGGFYTLASAASIDADGHDVYDIPREFSIDSGTAFLIARVTFQMGSTWSHVATVDLRGKNPNNAASGSSVNDHGGLGGLTDVADHPGYVTYTGATGAVDLGLRTLATTGTVTGSNIPSPSADDQILIATASGVAAWSSPAANQVVRSNDDSDTAWTDIDWPRILTANEVVYVTKAGNDSTGNGSVGDPYLTIARAITHVKRIIPGAYTVIIDVGEGVFSESQLIIKYPYSAVLDIRGQYENHSSLTASNYTGTTAGVGNLEYYDFDITLPVGKTTTVGDYIIVTSATGGTTPHLIRGCHEVVGWVGGTRVATLRCYIRDDNGGKIASGVITVNVSVCKTVISFATNGFKIDGSPSISVYGLAMDGNSGGGRGVWVTDNGAIFLKRKIGERPLGMSGFGRALYIENGGFCHAGAAHISFCTVLGCYMRNNGMLLADTMCMTATQNHAIEAALNSSVYARNSRFYSCGNVGIAADHEASIDIVSSDVMDGDATASVGLYAQKGGMIEATAATVSGYSTTKSPAANPGNTEAFIIGP